MSDVRLWTFANYRIRDILDVDLVSTTYRATTIEGDELRRVRVFTGDVTDGELAGISDAMVAEARAASEISHPNILTTHAAGRHGDRVYVVSDDVHGSVLREFIIRHQPLRPRMALAMGWQLAEALDAVHSAGVVHGSINPHTIWVSDVAGRDAPMTYLTGFGSALMLARQVKNQQHAPASDDLLYVGPDQMRQEQASPEADRYALACAVYHLMTSVPPFRRDSVNALFGAHLFSAVEPPTAIRDDLSPALDSVFARALAKETADRYPSAHALMIALERALRGQPETRRVASARRSDGAPAPDDDPRSSRGAWTVGAVGDVSAPPAAPPGTDVAGTAGVYNGDSPPASPSREAPAPDMAAAAEPDALPDGGDDVAAPVGEGDGSSVSAVLADGGDDVAAPVAEGDGSSVSATPPDDDDVAASAVTGRVRIPVEGVPGSPPEVDVVALERDDEAHAGDALVETPSGNGAAAPVPADVDEDDAPGVTDPPDTLRQTPRSHRHPAELFEWGGSGAGTLEERRAQRMRSNGDAGARQALGSEPPVPPGAVRAPAPDKRRGLIGTRNGVLLLVGGALLIAVAGTLGLAALRNDAQQAAPEDEPAQQQEQPPPAPEPFEPAVVQPLWTTPVADRTVRDIVATDDAVLVNAGRTLAALAPSSGNTLWTTATDQRVDDLVVVRDVAVAVTDGGLSGYDVTTGEVRWESDAAAVVPEALATDRREIFAATRDASGIALSTIDPRDGAVEPLGTIFSSADPNAGGIALEFDRSAEREGGQILYALTRAALYAFDPQTGAEVWRAPVNTNGQFDEPELRERPWVPSLEAIAGAAFVVGRDGLICRYAASSGEEVWTTCQQFPADLEAAPSLYARDARVVVASPDAIAAFDYTNGLPQWSRTLADELEPSLAGSPGLTYVVREDGMLRALDHDSGLERWRAQDVSNATALLADQDGVYVGSERGSVVRLAQQALGGSDGR